MRSLHSYSLGNINNTIKHLYQWIPFHLDYTSDREQVILVMRSAPMAQWVGVKARESKSHGFESHSCHMLQEYCRWYVPGETCTTNNNLFKNKTINYLHVLNQGVKAKSYIFWYIFHAPHFIYFCIYFIFMFLLIWKASVAQWSQ